MEYKETLKVKKHILPSGRPSRIGWYEYTIIREDADNTIKVLDHNDIASLGDVCKVINAFGHMNLESRKLAIRAFLEKDEYEHTEEY